jgi:hypothetical protein
MVCHSDFAVVGIKMRWQAFVTNVPHLFNKIVTEYVGDLQVQIPACYLWMC